MELQTFTSRNRTELNPDIMMGLTEFEKTLTKYFDRVEIRGKRSRMVPVLLTPEMIAAMNLLVEKRNECQIHTDNVYLFARPGGLSHYRGSDCFRKAIFQIHCVLFPFMTAGKMRSKWTGDEVQAVERHLFSFITSCRVPGKKDCDSCLKAEPVVLKDRDWVAIKYYIHNRIIALKRKMNA
ncbi:hypothetical protein F7725_028793 [Dissostichus mawsoni]|uniref:Uncharacterized protein n=1 Tax=Dissostichus mawsoni TaxID=36200 RepID=A0A7J5XGN1_DISMA|nr:hypothetical protein F7725_028793 [Dissostichus mawsoni]